jgi:hypothetical protein
MSARLVWCVCAGAGGGGAPARALLLCRMAAAGAGRTCTHATRAQEAVLTHTKPCTCNAPERGILHPKGVVNLAVQPVVQQHELHAAAGAPAHQLRLRQRRRRQTHGSARQTSATPPAVQSAVADPTHNHAARHKHHPPSWPRADRSAHHLREHSRRRCSPMFLLWRTTLACTHNVAAAAQHWRHARHAGQARATASRAHRG